jgi:uncharacterized membrane-anchored protein
MRRFWRQVAYSLTTALIWLFVIGASVDDVRKSKRHPTEINLSMVLAALSIVPIVRLAVWYHKWRQPQAGHCQNCGYNLTGNVSGVCPECGKPIT